MSNFDYKKEFEEALKHINTLYEVMGWLGGDSYEMECVENATKEINEFVKRHTPIKNPEPFDIMDTKDGVYCLRNNKSIMTRAKNKYNAKNILGVSVKDVLCIKKPSTI